MSSEARFRSLQTRSWRSTSAGARASKNWPMTNSTVDPGLRTKSRLSLVRLFRPGLLARDASVHLDRGAMTQRLVKPLPVVKREVRSQPALQLRHRLVPPQKHVLVVERGII